MIIQIKEVPANMVAFSANGEVTQDDFDNIVFPAVNAAVEKNGELNFLLVLEPGYDFTAGAWLKDIWLGIKEMFNWRRAAIITDSEGIIRFTNAFSFLVPGAFKGFLPEEFDQAVTWVSAVEEND